MESKRLTIRFTKAMLAEIEKRAKADGISPIEWARRVLERELGIKAEFKIGLANVGKLRRKQIAASGGKAKAAAHSDPSAKS